MGPDYPHKEEYLWSPPTGSAIADAEVNGSLVSWREAWGFAGVPVTTGAQPWIAADFAAPDGFTEYALLVDYSFEFASNALAYFGVAVSGLDVAIQVDKKDGTPAERWAESICTLVCPVFAGDHSYHWRKEKVEHVFKRATSDAANVRVWVGADGRTDVWAALGGAKFSGGVEVRQICLTSTS